LQHLVEVQPSPAASEYICVSQAKKARLRGGLAGPDGMKSVFGQVVSKMSVFTHPNLMLASRLWKVQFVGESVSISTN